MMLHLLLFSLQCTPLYGQKYWAVYTLNLQELLMLMSEEELCSYWISRALDLHGISCHPLCSMLDVQSGHRWPFLFLSVQNVNTGILERVAFMF